MELNRTLNDMHQKTKEDLVKLISATPRSPPQRKTRHISKGWQRFRHERRAAPKTMMHNGVKTEVIDLRGESEEECPEKGEKGNSIILSTSEKPLVQNKEKIKVESVDLTQPLKQIMPGSFSPQEEVETAEEIAQALEGIPSPSPAILTPSPPRGTAPTTSMTAKTVTEGPSSRPTRPTAILFTPRALGSSGK